MRILATTVWLLLAITTFAQVKIGDNANSINPRSVLELESTTRGLLIPRMTQAQRNAISNPPNGLLIYQTDGTSGFYYSVQVSTSLPPFTATQWISLSTNIDQTWSRSSKGATSVGTVSPLRRPTSFVGEHTPFVGIGTDSALAALHVRTDQGPTGINGDLLLLDHPITLEDDRSVGMFFKTGNFHTGAIKTIGTGPNTARLGFFTFADPNRSNLLERLTILDDGKIGIGTSTPTLRLDVDGRMRLRHTTNNTAGIWLNRSDNTDASFVGQVNDTTFGIWHAPTSNWRFAFNHQNGRLGIGTQAPIAPLSFASATGSKISLWGSDPAAHYGLGVQGNLLQLYTDAANSDIAFGYGGSAPGTFSETMRIKGNGNVGIGTSSPTARLHLTGSLRYANGSQGAGKWLASDANGNAEWQSFSFPVPFWQYSNQAANIGSGIINLVAQGGGPAARFEVNNASSYHSAVRVDHNGTGIGLVTEQSGTGPAGLFRIINTANSQTAFAISHSGNGTPLNVEGAGTTLASFWSLTGGSQIRRIRFDNTGKGFFDGGTQTGGADIAEAFAVEGSRAQYEPGDVLVISPKADRTVVKSATPYSTAVVGVYATKPGVLLTERLENEPQDDLVPMGVVGVIPTKVCLEGGLIRRGDLLVTSSLTGHAMKADPAKLGFGMVIGKALENFEQGNTGLIQVLVNVK